MTAKKYQLFSFQILNRTGIFFARDMCWRTNVNFRLGFTIIIVNVSIVLGSLFKSGLIFCGSQSDKVIRKVGPGANTLTFYNHHPPIYILHMSTICHLFFHPCFIRPKISHPSSTIMSFFGQTSPFSDDTNHVNSLSTLIIIMPLAVRANRIGRESHIIL